MSLKRSSRKIGQAIQKFDFFGHPVEFNIGGEGKIPSKIGACASIILTMIFFAYAAVRGQMLVFKSNTDIVSNIIVDQLNSSDSVDLNQINHTIAFGVVGYFDNAGKDDDDYVQWVVSMEMKIGDNETSTPLNIHKCTSQDYLEFAPPAKSQTTMLQTLKDNQALWCIDKGQNLTIFGKGDNTDYRRLDTKLMPCKETDSKQCYKTKQETIDYVGPSQLIIYQNQPHFDQGKFDGSPILRQSEIHSVQFDHQQPNFFHGKLRQTTLYDSVFWVNLGFPSEYKYYKSEIGIEQRSGWIEYPESYRITGFELLYDFDVEEMSRSSYDVLGYLGDIGGIMQALEWIGMVLVATYYSPSNGNSFVVTQLFQQMTREFKQKKLLQMVKMFIVKNFCSGYNFDKLLTKNMRMEITMREDIPRWDFFTDVLGVCRRSPEIKRHRMLVKKGLERLDQELDILHILRQLRILKQAYLATQAGPQRKLVEQMSEKILSSANSSSSEHDSDEDFANQLKLKRASTMGAGAVYSQKDLIVKDGAFVKECVASKNEVCQNLIKLWKGSDNARIDRWQKQWGVEKSYRAQDNDIRRALRANLWDRVMNEEQKLIEMSQQEDKTTPFDGTMPFNDTTHQLQQDALIQETFKLDKTPMTPDNQGQVELKLRPKK